MNRLVFLALVVMAGMPLHSGAAEPTTLSVSITVFDPGVPADLSSHRDLGVFPRIREIEAMFLPFVLRETLVAARQWGAVRVIPQADPAAELLVAGTILRSDGENLEIGIRAVDASGRVWLDRAFAGSVPQTERLYDDIEIALRQARDQLDSKALGNIVDVSLLRYAVQLAPDAFADYLRQEADGTFTILRLPATNDPMFERIERIRSTEYVITDTIDAKFRDLHGEIDAVYNYWRDYRRKVREYQAQDAQRLQDTQYTEPRGSYEWMQNQYDNYKYSRITAQEQDRLAVAFDNEVGPKVAAMETRVAELQQWIDLKFADWQRRIAELIEAEAEANRPGEG